MPKKFNNPLDDDVWAQLDTNQDDFFDTLAKPAKPLSAADKELARSRAPRKQAATRDEQLFYSTHGPPDTNNRPMVGNYQFVNLLLRDDVAQYLRDTANEHRMGLAPFMRWVIDQIALLYEQGIRPPKDYEDQSGKTRLQALLAPTMSDLVHSWAAGNRMKFQTFMRWAIFEFLREYGEQGLLPQEPEEFIPGEAELCHWASNTVEKFEGTGKSKFQ
jgi:hypothetical protein